MIFTNLTTVFIEGHVQRPVQLVLNMPVLTNQGCEVCCTSSQTGQAEAIGAGDLGAAVRRPNRFNRNDRSDAGPLLQFSNADKVAQDPEASSNSSPVGEVKGIEEGILIAPAEAVLDVVMKVAADGTVGPFVIALERDEIIACWSRICLTIALWHPMASIVTTEPLMAKSSRSSGMAVISLDLLCVLSWPMTSPPFCEHQADTTCTGQFCSPVKRRFDGFAIERDHGALGELGRRPGPTTGSTDGGVWD